MPSAAAAAYPGDGPAPLRSLKQFGARGDGVSDDTPALQKALGQSDQFCLDGEGLTYSVNGTLRITKNLCLVNIRLEQRQVPYDTSAMIKGDCPAISDPAIVVSCGDPALVGDAPAELQAYLNVRTLLVRPDDVRRDISVFMDKVVIDKGNDPRSGSRTDAAGIWIDHAKGVVLTDVEITGAGKGYGLFISASSDVTLTRLNVHDLTWAPYAGDADLTMAGVAASGWNTFPIREFRYAGQDGLTQGGFKGVRVQEQISCVTIASSNHVVFRDATIERCGAEFAEGFIPWQADGLTVGGTSSDLTIEGDTRIASTWEGIDLIGGNDGIDQVHIRGATISDSFSFGVKWGYKVSNSILEDTNITNAGLAGVVIYGPVRSVAVNDVRISGIGSVNFPTGVSSPWDGNKVGLLIAAGANPGTRETYPQGVEIDGLSVNGGPHCHRGYLNEGGSQIRIAGSRLTNCNFSSKLD
ncbi:right-handed parallel beta-helix repeat-containing protein [Croceibacterium ferulae]|uniref:right-handed parallel beta-helix repeat-containing protein n=1 Tax=Croceibacterium ferulae TaxID=1854641 RepID=UPI0019D4DD07|nr:right-handed parallel beta-helix repeat-containing protein [Croceibacterium ferulae]